MRCNLFFGIFLLISLSSCDKLKSISTNKTLDDKSSVNSERLSVDLSNPEVTKASLDNLVKKSNYVEDIYIDKNSPKFSTKDCFYPYIRVKGDDVSLYLKVQHVSVELLNINTYVVTVDKVDYTIKGEVSKKKLNGKKKSFMETLDKLITSDEDMQTLKAIAEGEYVKTLLVGENKFIKSNMSEKNRKAFYNVLVAYLYLKNK